jgi:3-deoxy-manno-octulosonate cytidylyltransferase (CMP-KDO synthetase)
MGQFKIVIPARHGSSRLPGKPLLAIAGKPMIVHVCERALEASPEVFVATDDARICDAVQHLPVSSIMTRADHNSGTERITEVADMMNWSDEEIVVNLQGDEPLMDPSLINQLAMSLKHDCAAGIATLATPIFSRREVFDPNCVKVVLDQNSYALYFSRAAIPWDREGFKNQENKLPEGFNWLRHIGMYAYSIGFLRRYICWPCPELEKTEALEQLRILWRGEKILVNTIQSAPPSGVDTEDDLLRVRSFFSQS